MNLSPILNVAISLIFVFFIFSLFVSGIGEIISSGLNQRANFLEKALVQVLKPSLVSKLYGHPLINSFIEKNDSMPSKLRLQIVKWLKILLGWIPLIRYFVLSIDLNSKPSYLSAKTFSQTVLDLMNKELQAQNLPLNVENLVKLSKNLPQEIKNEVGEELEQLFSALSQNILNKGQNELLVLNDNLERWFNDYMDRVSGWYKRHIQVVLRYIALGVAILFNVDALVLTQSLYQNSSLANSVASMATKVVVEQPENGLAVKPKEQIAQLQNTGLPIGWPSDTCQNCSSCPEALSCWASQVFSFWKIVGWLITASALSFGAPFWFDLLVKFVNIRNAGTKPKS